MHIEVEFFLKKVIDYLQDVRHDDEWVQLARATLKGDYDAERFLTDVIEYMNRIGSFEWARNAEYALSELQADEDEGEPDD